LMNCWEALPVEALCVFDWDSVNESSGFESWNEQQRNGPNWIWTTLEPLGADSCWFIVWWFSEPDTPVLCWSTVALPWPICCCVPLAPPRASWLTVWLIVELCCPDFEIWLTATVWSASWAWLVGAPPESEDCVIVWPTTESLSPVVVVCWTRTSCSART